MRIHEPAHIGSGIGWILEKFPVDHKALVEYKDYKNVKHTKMIAHEHFFDLLDISIEHFGY